MDIILLERVEKLGAMGETVRVKDGYARNFLLPKGMALRATKANQARFEADRAAFEARDVERREAAKTESEKLDGTSYVLLRQAGESGQLYGSVTTRDIAEAAAHTGIAVTRNHVKLDTPIKTIGIFEVRIALHPDVTSTVRINVARTEDEAAMQERGENLGDQDEDSDDAWLAADALLEDGKEEAQGDGAPAEDESES